MPRYLTQHTLACLTRQGAENLAQRMQSGGTAHAERVLVNMLEGKMFVEFRHVKQYLDAKDLAAAWNFLLPIGTRSRYINEYHHPEESELFPAPPHIKKAINCFKEVMPNGTEDDYSYLSEFCHPNTMTFQQHYQWTTPYVIDFADQVSFGAFGAIAGSLLQGLMAIQQLLAISNEQQS